MKMLTVLMMVLAPALAQAADSGAKPAPKVEVQKVEARGTLQGVLDELWTRLRRYGPTQQTARAEGTGTVVAGVRGSEATSSNLQPYWKGDRSRDPAYLAEVGAYTQAQAQVDAGDIKQAATLFGDFLKNYPASSLRPNARFGLALAYVGQGDKTHGREQLQAFVTDYPGHPLVADANRLMGELQKL